MRVHFSTRYATLAALVAGMACAGNKARTEDTNQAAAAKDTTTTGRDTLNGQAENPPGYRGMERDTTQTPTGQTPSDTFLQNQGQGTPQDTAGYSGIERDTSGQVNQQAQPGQADTSGMAGDTTGVTGADTTGNQSSEVNPSSTGQVGADSSGMAPTGDTTGYGQSQQSRDSTNR